MRKKNYKGRCEKQSLEKFTTDYVSGMVGQYDVTKMAYKRKGVFGGKSDGNYSSERRAVVEARDMMELRERGEANENYILKSPVRRIHKIRTTKPVKETIPDESMEIMRDNVAHPRDLAIIDMLA